MLICNSEGNNSKHAAVTATLFRSHQPACIARFIPYLRKYIAANNGIKTKVA